jgi:Ca-activated chloride channel family protein
MSKLTLLSCAITLALIAGCAKKSTEMRQDAAPPPASAEQDAGASESLDSIVVTGSRIQQNASESAQPVAELKREEQARAMPATPAPGADAAFKITAPAQAGAVTLADKPKQDSLSSAEQYAESVDSPVKSVERERISTFAVDVDTGSYTNVRRMLNDGYLPPKDAVRPEEFVNYFDYGYPRPSNIDPPFSVTQEFSPSPWDQNRDLLLLGLQGFEVQNAQLPKSNLVFLLDVSGSMDEPNKLPLVKGALRMLVNDLDADDSVAIVVYAGAAGMVLPPTPGNQRERIVDALDALSAGGSTNGGEGIQLAYDLAQQAFIRGGINRVVLCTDGDFNVGVSSVDALKKLVEEKRSTSISLSTLGFGAGNYNDEMAEQLANVGNGNHAYIDTLNEARKVLIEQRSGTFMTIASDVKVQIEFNPAVVAEYRLVGYQNRALRTEDFDDDRKDAGEIGAGHSVTALYELCLVGKPCQPKSYQVPNNASMSGELGYLKLRYKSPGQDVSKLLSEPLRNVRTQSSDRLQLASAVAGFADRLRGDQALAHLSYRDLSAMAETARINDQFGYKQELLNLMATAESLSSRTQ